ncbi:MAG: hypothetical protein HYR91_13540 [Flavobacteriia bacterium]|nr:hypothetical protein [Flavobacteriia bacterium]
MRTVLKTFLFLGFVVFTLFIFNSCKNKENSVLKIYVRSKSNELVSDAKVIIIGDVNSNPPTIEYVDTAATNSSGFATFDMQPYFDKAGEKKNPTGYFDIIFKKDTKTGEGRVRCRVHITTVETLYFTE